MEPRNYQDRFHEALQRAFAAANPAVRGAYFELASFYREKIGEQLQMQPSLQLLRTLALSESERKRAA